MSYFRSVLCFVDLVRCLVLHFDREAETAFAAANYENAEGSCQKGRNTKWFNSASMKEVHKRYSHGPKLSVTVSELYTVHLSPYISKHSRCVREQLLQFQLPLSR